jgi:hypothetical protein
MPGTLIAAAYGAAVALSRPAHDIRQALPNALVTIDAPPYRTWGDPQLTVAARGHLIELAYQQND